MIELGLVVSEGEITFSPVILRKSEFLSKPATLDYFDVNGERQAIALAEGQLGFTYCQVPVVYSLADEFSIVVTMSDGASKTIAGNAIDTETSMLIFDKKNAVAKIEVALKPGLE